MMGQWTGYVGVGACAMIALAFVLAAGVTAAPMNHAGQVGSTYELALRGGAPNAAAETEPATAVPIPIGKTDDLSRDEKKDETRDEDGDENKDEDVYMTDEEWKETTDALEASLARFEAHEAVQKAMQDLSVASPAPAIDELLPKVKSQAERWKEAHQTDPIAMAPFEKRMDEILERLPDVHAHSGYAQLLSWFADQSDEALVAWFVAQQAIDAQAEATYDMVMKWRTGDRPRLSSSAAEQQKDVKEIALQTASEFINTLEVEMATLYNLDMMAFKIACMMEIILRTRDIKMLNERQDRDVKAAYTYLHTLNEAAYRAWIDEHLRLLSGDVVEDPHPMHFPLAKVTAAVRDVAFFRDDDPFRIPDLEDTRSDAFLAAYEHCLLAQTQRDRFRVMSPRASNEHGVRSQSLLQYLPLMDENTDVIKTMRSLPDKTLLSIFRGLSLNEAVILKSYDLPQSLFSDWTDTLTPVFWEPPGHRQFMLALQIELLFRVANPRLTYGLFGQMNDVLAELAPKSDAAFRVWIEAHQDVLLAERDAFGKVARKVAFFEAAARGLHAEAKLLSLPSLLLPDTVAE